MQRLIPALCLAVFALASACDDSPSGSRPTPPAGTAPFRTYAAAPVPVMILDTSLPAGVSGQPYSHQLSAIGGSGTYYWSVTGGSAVAMVNLSVSGELTFPGMPQNSFGGNLFISVVDAFGASANRQFNIHANMGATLPVYFMPATTFVLHCGDNMALVDHGKTYSRFQRSVRALMREIAALTWDPVETCIHSEFQVVLCGHDATWVLRPTSFTATNSEKVNAITLLAGLTPGGTAPMYSAAVLAETTTKAFSQAERVCLFSGAGFSVDTAAPGGQADYVNVLAQFASWTSGTTLHTNGFDLAPTSHHLQFMQDFVALGAQGAYSAPQ